MLKFAIDSYFKRTQNSNFINRTTKSEKSENGRDEIGEGTGVIAHETKSRDDHPKVQEDHVKDVPEESAHFYGKIKTAESMTGGINDVFTIDVNGVEHFASCRDLKWQLISGDKVEMIRERDEDGKLMIVDLKPKMRREMEYGRLTAFCPDKGYAAFEENTIVLFNALMDITGLNLRMHDEYKYEAIESDQNFDGKLFDYRVLKVIEKVQSKFSERGIIIESHPFKISLNPDKNCDELILSRFIRVKNISNASVNLMTVAAIPLNDDGDKVVDLDMAGRNIEYNLSARNGNFKIHFRIRPVQIGEFRYKLIAKFDDFEEIHLFSVEIIKTYIVSGPKVRSTPRFVDIRLDQYSVPAELMEIDYSKSISATEELSEKFPFLPENTDASNYLEKMRFGLYLEEIALERAFANYRMENAVFETKDDFLRLAVRDLAEKRPSIVIGDKIIATDPHRRDVNEKPVFEGTIHKIEDESILCKFQNDFHSTHHEKTFLIDFTYSRTTYRRQQHALDVFVNETELGYDFLFPRKIEPKSPKIDAKLHENGSLIISDSPRIWFNNLLNKYQKNAVVNVLRAENRPLPYIFFGCPGSGKTQTVVEAILQVYTNVKSSRIIVATPSNSAANLITEMLMESHAFDERNHNQPFKSFIRLVSNNQVEKDLIPDSILKYCATVNIACDQTEDQLNDYERTKSSGLLSSLNKKKILEYRIVIATLNCFGSLLQMKFTSKFSHVFIDEAGQSVEPETLIPLTMLNETEGQCILAGDPNQLGPILVSNYNKIFQFNYSLLERLLFKHPYYQPVFGEKNNEYDPRFVTKLKINYRALPSLLKVYNDLFYNGELESAVDEKTSEEAILMSTADSFLWKYTNRKCSTFFINVDNGRNRKIKDSCSWYNDEEIRAIMSFLHKLNSSGISFKDVGIVTPYALQVKKLKHQIAVGTSDADLKIGTVEEFQGQERLIIIVSTVRTEEKFLGADYKFGLGFLQCPKRMNVAISRGKALLVVFGKENVLKKDENWNHLIKYAKDNRTYVSDKF